MRLIEYPVPDIYEGDEAEAMRQHYFNVGRVTVELATLEEVLAELVLQLAATAGESVNVLELGASSRKLEEALRRVSSAGGEHDATVENYLDRYLYFREQRNVAAHSSIVTAFGEGRPGGELAMHHPKSNGLFRLPTSAEVEVLLREMGDVRHSAYELHLAVMDARVKART